jgi:hypothetical protein
MYDFVNELIYNNYVFDMNKIKNINLSADIKTILKK